MSENKKKTVDELQREYTQLCSKAGHIQYQISVMKSELAIVNDSLKVINLEAAAVAAEVKKEETVNE